MLFESTPVAFVRWRNIWRVTPLAHLQYPNEEQWMDSKYTRRNCDAHNLPSPLGSITEIVCVGESLQMAIELHRSLNGKVRENPIS